MSGPLPAPGYISNSSRTDSDAQNEWELDIAVAKETIGGAPEGATLSISSNSITPVDNACVFPVDASGGGTINTIQVTNIRDGQVIFLHCVNSSDPITIANLATGSGASVATFSGLNVVMTDPKMFVSLKYNLAANQFQELFPGPNWAAPGAIGSTTPSTGSFTSVSLTGAVGAHTWLGNNTSGSAAPSFSSLTAGDLPSSIVASSGSLSPLFSTSVSSQSLSFSLSNAGAGTLFGNFAGSTGAPSYHSPGSADQVLGVMHSGGGLEYKSIVAGSNITVTAAAGSITIASTGGSGTVTSFSAGNAAPFFTTSVATATSTPSLTFNVTSQSANTVCAGPATGSATAPTFRSLVANDIPAIPLATGITGVLPVANGGTNAASLTANGVAVANSGATALTTIAPGTSGNVLTSNGTSWSSAAPSSNFAPTFTSSAQTLALNTEYAINHGLGRVPYLTRCYLKCLRANNGYSVGDLVDIASTAVFAWTGTTNAGIGIQISSNTTQIVASTANSNIYMIPKGGGEGATITFADWALYLAAW